MKVFFIYKGDRTEIDVEGIYDLGTLNATDPYRLTAYDDGGSISLTHKSVKWVKAARYDYALQSAMRFLLDNPSFTGGIVVTVFGQFAGESDSKLFMRREDMGLPTPPPDVVAAWARVLSFNQQMFSTSRINDTGAEKEKEKGQKEIK